MPSRLGLAIWYPLKRVAFDTLQWMLLAVVQISSPSIDIDAFVTKLFELIAEHKSVPWM